MTYGCFDRAPYVSVVPAQDGHYMDGYTRTPRMVSMPFRMSKPCNYTTTDLGQADPKCNDCFWRKDGQAGTGAEVAGDPGERPAGDVAGSSGEEGEGPGGERSGGFQDASKAAEAKRRFEKTWPAAQIYQPTEE